MKTEEIGLGEIPFRRCHSRRTRTQRRGEDTSALLSLLPDYNLHSANVRCTRQGLALAHIFFFLGRNLNLYTGLYGILE